MSALENITEAGARPLRLAMVAQFPVHYHLTLYRHLAKDPATDLDVLFMQKAWSEDGVDPDVHSTRLFSKHQLYQRFPRIVWFE
jgi:hypothetical protein